jgi:rhodanese-related sulfurtransferase
MKFFTALLFSLAMLTAQMSNQALTKEFLNKKIPMFDIRTQGEWAQTGIIKGSIPLTFFDERGNYDVNAFLAQVHKHVKKDQPFALICQTGSRSRTVASFLAKNGYEVINIQGGIITAPRNNIKLVPLQ